jgi:hypothetical protein
MLIGLAVFTAEVQTSQNVAVPMSCATAIISNIDDLAPSPSQFNHLAS